MARLPPHPTPRARIYKGGFTLIETLITVAVLAVIVATATPALSRFVQRQRGITANNLLATHLNLARSHAVSRRTVVAICPSVDMSNCQAASDWTPGWIVFADPDGNRRPDHPDDVLSRETRSANSIVRLTSSVGRTQVRFLPDGRSPGTNITITTCANNQLVTQIILNNAGRVRLSPTNQDTSCS